MNSNYNRQDFGQNYNHQTRQPFLKMDFPRFVEGDDPMGWIYRAEHYFEFFNTEDSKKVKLASFHMEEETLQLFQWANYESLVKLRQIGTLNDYVIEFWHLANRTREISQALLKFGFLFSEDVDNEELEITACALYGIPAPPTIKIMKVNGFIKNCHVTILIDSGSSHNFVDLDLVKWVKGNLNTGYTFNVKIANGGKV
ncbi:hypothetical protein D8674_015324 [Pyrus ussuriensis x Pyrus communis]|uniref:Retrotransposon gag domain-containing protein n=1 Tax=Pyrus ussuriensis x Pyrus communis TaxID=2448454 RepID=A0A5N5GV19_9ROSA|nr:hypothetical protein D8674_015324 [Pyrus ussuriensis x Pyrus communis]